MLKVDTTPNRAPRGTKPVSRAFFEALDAVPEASRAAVARAAQLMIRDELKLRRDKSRAAATKEKARVAGASAAERAAKRPVRGGATKAATLAGAAQTLPRRGRKPALKTTED